MLVFVVSRSLVGVFQIHCMSLVCVAVFMFVSCLVSMSVLMRVFMTMRVPVAVLVGMRASVSVAMFMHMGMHMLVIVAMDLVTAVLVRVDMDIYLIGCSAIACFTHDKPPLKNFVPNNFLSRPIKSKLFYKNKSIVVYCQAK